MSALKKQLFDIALQGLDLIGDIAEEHGGSKGETAAQALAAVSAIVKAIKAGHETSQSPDEVIDAINKSSADLDAQIAAHRKLGEDLLDQKFGKKTETAPPSDG